MKEPEQSGGSVFPLTRNAVKGQANRSGKNTGPIFTHSRTVWTYTKWTLAILVCLISTIGGTLAGNFYWKSPLVRAVVNGIITHPFNSFKDPMASFTPENTLPADKQHTINVLLLGCDSDYDPRRPVPLKGTKTRSDAILIAHVDFDAQTINVLSIPRDTAVHIPDHGYGKINSAHALGGPELTQETVKSVFGLDTDYYMTLNFDAFVKVVDALGGVDLTVHKQLDYDDNWGNLHVHLKPGAQHLNGYHAMGYVRIRHSDDDIQRTIRQQEFLEALRSKVKSPKNLMKLPNALNAIMDNVKSNMTQEQMLTLANFARRLPHQNIQVATLPVNEGPSYVYMKVKDSQDIIRKLFYNDDKWAEVVVKAPGQQMVERLTNRARKRRHGHPAVDGPQDDEGQPLLSTPDETPLVGENNTPKDDNTPPEATDTNTQPKPDTTPGGDTTDKPDTTPKTEPAPDKPADGDKPDKTTKPDKGDQKDKPAPKPDPDKNKGTDTNTGING